MMRTVAGEPVGAEVGASRGETDVSADDEPADMDTSVDEAMQCLHSNADDIITTGLPTDGCTGMMN